MNASYNPKLDAVAREVSQKEIDGHPLPWSIEYRFDNENHVLDAAGETIAEFGGLIQGSFWEGVVEAVNRDAVRSVAPANAQENRIAALEKALVFIADLSFAYKDDRGGSLRSMMKAILGNLGLSERSSDSLSEIELLVVKELAGGKLKRPSLPCIVMAIDRIGSETKKAVDRLCGLGLVHTVEVVGHPLYYKITAPGLSEYHADARRAKRGLTEKAAS